MPPASLTLCYHAVTSAWDDALAVEPEQLARQLGIVRRRWRGGSADDVLAHPRGVVHATFDDAYASVLDAIPILERHQVGATVFACGAYGDGRLLDVPELRGERFSAEGLRTMTWDDLRGLKERGVEIGSHTMSHPHLPTLADEELDRELVEARQRLEDELGGPCRYLAYPYGDLDDRVCAAARRAGYRAAFGLPGRRGDVFALPRVGIYRKDGLPRFVLKSHLASRIAARRS